MKTLKEKLGSRIKYLRKELGLSQYQLSELIGLDIPNLSNIERLEHGIMVDRESFYPANTWTISCFTSNKRGIKL